MHREPGWEPQSTPLHGRRAERSSAPSTLQARRSRSAPEPASPATTQGAAADDSMAGKGVAEQPPLRRDVFV